MPSQFDVLIDSSAFVAWIYEHDTHFQNATKYFASIKQQRLVPVTTNLIVIETATVLSHRSGQSLANTFLDMVSTYPIVHVSEDLQTEALKLFRQQTKKGTSVIDCSNVVVMKQFEIPTIFSFDEVFEKSFQLSVIK